MASCEEISLQELFSQYTDTGQAVCFKNIPVTASKDSLIFFIEAILKMDVIAMYFPLLELKDCCIAVMEEPVLDMTVYTKRLQEKTLEKHKVSIYPLGPAEGLIIRQVPPETSNQFLELYFESPRSCGEGDCVEEVKSCKCCQNRLVVIVIKDIQVLRRIINKPSHPSLDKYHLHLDPYFPVFHDDVYARHCEAQSPKNTSPYDREPVQDWFPQKSEGVGNLKTQSLPNHPKVNVAEEITKSISGLVDTTHKEDSITSHTTLNLAQHGSELSGREFAAPGNQQTKPNQQKESTKLRIFSEDDILLPVGSTFDHDVQSGHSLDTHMVKQSPLSSRTADEIASVNEFTKISTTENTSSFPFNTGARQKPIKAVKPFYNKNTAPVSPKDETEERDVEPKFFSSLPKLHSGAEAHDEKPHGSRGTQRNERHRGRRKPELPSPDFKPDDTNTVKMPKTDIVLLKINGFTNAKKCGDCKVALNEKQGRVEFDGDIDSISKAKIKMYETLQNKEETTIVLPKHLVQYIDQSQGYLRAQLTKRKIGAALKIDVSQSTVQCLAFTTKQAERGLEFVTKELSSRQIKIREGQSQCFESTEWDSLVKSLQKYVQVTVVKEDDVVDIVAYNKDSVNNAHEKIIQYLKASKPKHKTEIELKGATAKCFRRYFLDDLKQMIRKQHGDIKWNSEDMETLKIEVEGDSSLFNMVQDKVKQVWHENVDFKRITTDVSELWLLMKGLVSQKAKEFVDKFEREHGCFIEMLKEGEVSLPPVSIQRTTTESPDTRISAIERDDEFDIVPKHRQCHEMSEEFQYGLTDDEALQIGMMQSISEPTFHAHDEELQLALQAEEIELSRSQTTGNLRSYGDHRVNRHVAEAYHPMKECTKKIGNITVTIKQGSIATDKLSSQRVAKVNVLGPSRDLKDSVISKSFVRAGGQELVRNFESAKDQFSSNVVVTQGCRSLNCDHVLHVSLQKTPQPQVVISRVMQECFQHCATYGCNCIVLPPLGVGRLYKYQPYVVAKSMIASVQSGTPRLRNLNEIVIIIYDQDEDIYQVFEDQLNDTADTLPHHFLGLMGRSRPPATERPMPSYGQMSQLGRPEQGPVKPIPPPRRPPFRKAVSEDLSNQAQANPKPGCFGAVGPRPAYRNSQNSSKSDRFIPEMLPSFDRDSSDRTHRYSREYESRKPQYKRPRERSPPESPVAKYKMKVFSRDKQTCERARNDLGRHLKSHFLYEVKLERKGKLSSECKKRIRDALRKRNVKSFLIPGTKDYAIKGEERSVTEAHAEVLKIILEFVNGDKPIESHRAKRRGLRGKPNEYIKYMAVKDEGEVPSYWKHWKSGSLIREALTTFKTITKDFITVTLDESDPVYQAIISLIGKTWDGTKVGQGKDARGLETLNYTNIRVAKIRRVENLQLFDKYINRRRHIFLDTHKKQKSSCTPISKLPSSTGSAFTEKLQRCRIFEDELCSEVNEHFFFHGTTRDTVDVICDSGLDSRLGSQQAMYGAGIYGAESPTKADQYADPKDKRTKDGKKMILMRMVLGESYLCTDQNPHKYRRPPCADMKCLRDDCKNKSHGSFDSVIGQSGRLFREFVVYQPDQCYPEYVISYDRI